MRFLREHIIFRYLWFALALHILNFSVDAVDSQPDSIPEDLSINDMESLVEIILEQVLDIENAIPEHDEPDNDGKLNLKVSIDFFVSNYLLTTTDIKFFRSDKVSQYKLNFDQQFQPELSPPPPEA